MRSALTLGALSVAAAAASAAPVVQGHHRVTLEPQIEPVPLNAFHAWRLHVERTDGAPLALRHLEVDGGMPAHGHGLPSAPRLAQGPTANDFVVEGLRFSMAGRWELRVAIVDRDGTDVATFPLEVGAAGAPSRAELWSASEREVLRSLSIDRLGAPPPDPSNRVADDPRAAALGQALFFARGLSDDGQRACATCHDPARYFTDGRTTGRGARSLDRNTPTVVGAGFGRWSLWDGRRDSLWSQGLDPIEAPAELRGARVAAVAYVARHHRAAYEAVFGALPDLGGVPPIANPIGDAGAQSAWARVAPARREAITRAFTNLGKAIAAYERQLRPGRSDFDRYVDAVLAGDDARARTILSPRAIAGLKLFVSPRAQCTRCHNGPLFSNGEFANIGTRSPDPDHPDFGRAIGIQAALATEFNCLGPYSDRHECPELTFLSRHEENGALVGAFKVPGLRGVARTAPYMHDGRFPTLDDVIEHYRSPARAPGTLEFRPLTDLTPEQAADLVAFLRSLDAPPVTPAVRRADRVAPAGRVCLTCGRSSA